MATYKRILLKLSGEQLGYTIKSPKTGEQVQIGFDPERAKWLGEQIRQLQAAGIEVVATIGGGNFVRGEDIKCDVIDQTVGDEAGILAIVINAILLGEVFSHLGVPTHAMSMISLPAFIDDYAYRTARQDLANGKLVLIGGGSGQTGFTSDTGALRAAISLHCDAVIKLTDVDGVYDDDPHKNDQANKFDELTYDQAISNPNITVMDKAAMGMAAQNKIPIIVCELKDGNMLRAAQGEPIGTLVH